MDADWRDEARHLRQSFAWIGSTDDPSRLRLGVIDLHASLELILKGFVGEVEPTLGISDPLSFPDLLRITQENAGLGPALVESLYEFNRTRNRVAHRRESVDKGVLQAAYDDAVRLCDEVLKFSPAGGGRHRRQSSADEGSVHRGRMHKTQQAVKQKTNSLRIGEPGQKLPFWRIAWTLMQTSAIAGWLVFIAVPVLALFIFMVFSWWKEPGADASLLAHLLFSIVGVVATIVILGAGGELVLVILGIVGGLLGGLNSLIIIVVSFVVSLFDRSWWQHRFVAFAVALIACTAAWGLFANYLISDAYRSPGASVPASSNETITWVTLGAAVVGFVVTLATEIYVSLDAPTEESE